MKQYSIIGKLEIQVKLLLVIVVAIMISGCTETFKIEDENIEDFLVINALITDKMGNQEIVLSRTFGFENSSEPIPEQGAVIVVVENDMTEYQFTENSEGIYSSVDEFAVTAGNTYRLSVRTVDGRSYGSQKVIAPKPTTIDRVYARRMFNDRGTDGIGIFLDTFDPTGNSLYYRYGFEETSRFTAPEWISVDITSNFQGGSINFEYVERPEAEKVCYNTQPSKTINIANTSGFIEDRIDDLMIHFIPADDIRIAERYSILVKQYVQTIEAQSFYRVLNDFSGSENIFSQVQPGFISGNIFSETDGDEKVLGFFDISSLAEERIFFNRDEFLEDVPFVLKCESFVPEPSPFSDLETFLEVLNGVIRSNDWKLLFPRPLPPPDVFPVVTFVPRICGDCTVVGKSEVPEFWIE